MVWNDRDIVSEKNVDTLIKNTQREKAPLDKTPVLTKSMNWTFGFLVPQINSLQEVLKL